MESDFHIAIGVNSKEAEQQDREAQERGATVAEEWQWNTNHRHNSKHHTNINGKMEEENRG